MAKNKEVISKIVAALERRIDALKAKVDTLEEENASLINSLNFSKAEIERLRRVFGGESDWVLVEPNKYEAMTAEREQLNAQIKMLKEDLGRLQEDYFAAERGASILNRELQRMRAKFDS